VIKLDDSGARAGQTTSFAVRHLRMKQPSLDQPKNIS